MPFIGRKSRHGKGGANQTFFFMITRTWVIMPDRISDNVMNMVASTGSEWRSSTCTCTWYKNSVRHLLCPPCETKSTIYGLTHLSQPDICSSGLVLK